MSKANFEQTSFLGGEWSPYAQGRSDLPAYRTALNFCSNMILNEEGALVRRSGFIELGPTFNGAPGIIRRFEVDNSQPVLFEITYTGSTSQVRYWFFNGFRYVLVYDTTQAVTSISTAKPAVITLAAPVTWNTGEVVYIEIDQTIASNIAPQLANRQFVITKIDTTHFSIADSITNAPVDGSALNAVSGLSGNNSQVRHVFFSAGPWTSLSEVQQLDVVQADTVAYMLSGSRAPQIITYTPPAGPAVNPTFAMADAGFGSLDGPYLDPLPGLSQTRNSTGTLTNPSVHGNGEFVPTNGAGPGGTATFQVTDGAYTFTSNDVGRCIRMWDQPPAYSGITYVGGNVATSGNAFWRRDPGNTPSTQTIPGHGVPYYDSHTTTTQFPWQLAPQLGGWIYGTIASITNGSTVVVNINANAGNQLQSWSASGPPADSGNGTNIDTWQLGAYGNSIGGVARWPTCGTFHEGRLWLGGAWPNRFDASMPLVLQSGGSYTLQFSPTNQQGQVLPNSAINYTVNSPGTNRYHWMIPDHQGILAGTTSGEWLVASSNLSNPLTPTDIQAKKTSNYKSSSAKPVRVGNAIVFIQRSTQRMMEYIADVFSGKFIGRHLNKFARHLGLGGWKEICYHEEPQPVVWGCDNFGFLAGCTYRRVSQFGSEEPVFYGWHHHLISDGLGNRSIQSVTSGANNDGSSDTLAVISLSTNGQFYVQLLASSFDVQGVVTQARLLDSYFTGGSLQGQGGICGYDPDLYLGGGIINNLGATGGFPGIFLNGMYYRAGQRVTVSILGLDCGDYTVAQDGSVFVPYQSDPDKLLSPAFIANMSAGTSKWGDLGTYIEVPGTGGVKFRAVVPVVVGSVYTSQWQIVRPVTQQETRGGTGPGLGKLRRINKWSALFVRTAGNQNALGGGLQIGGDFQHLRPVKFYNPDNNTPLAAGALFDGVVQEQLDDDDGYDGMICGQQTRPMPMGIAAIGCFLDVEDI